MGPPGASIEGGEGGEGGDGGGADSIDSAFTSRGRNKIQMRRQ
jgi:hypothetical protein